MFSLWLDYPSPEEELTIVKTTTGALAHDVEPVLVGPEIITLQDLVRRIPVSDHVVEYAVNLIRMTRPNEGGAPRYISEWIRWGAGPRAGQYLILGAKTRAALEGRPTPDVEDVRAIAHAVLRHRLVLSFNAEAEGIDAAQVIDKLLDDKTINV
jgi:MoxR-like ATPase